MRHCPVATPGGPTLPPLSRRAPGRPRAPPREEAVRKEVSERVNAPVRGRPREATAYGIEIEIEPENEPLPRMTRVSPERFEVVEPKMIVCWFETARVPPDAQTAVA